jgi:L-lactate dehydrogenase (cytochrome)
VSNHGGRQLDAAATPFHILPGIVAAAKGVTVIIDSEFRRGTDVLTGLALGADFVLIGRPFLFAAAVAGQAGVLHAIELLSKEIDRDMALLGCTTSIRSGRRCWSTCAVPPSVTPPRSRVPPSVPVFTFGFMWVHGVLAPLSVNWRLRS